MLFPTLKTPIFWTFSGCVAAIIIHIWRVNCEGVLKTWVFFSWVFLNLSRLLCPTCSCRCNGGNRQMLAFYPHLRFVTTLSTKKSLMASLECDEGLMNIAHKGGESGRAYHSSCSATVVFIYCNVRRSRCLPTDDEVLALLLQWHSWRARG